MIKAAPLLLVFWVLLMIGCTNRSKQTGEDKLEVTVDTSLDVTLALEGDAEEDILFYNMLYPFDLGVIIDKGSDNYNSGLLNPLTNFSNYTESSKRALAIGVYGADLSYLWGFHQSQQALSYFTAIINLADNLGIPNEYVSASAAKAELYTDNVDSLVSIARKAYSDYDSYLIKSNQPDLAVLVFLGGWVETMHTAVNLYTEPNSRMACKIISQKYSLASLLNLLYEQADNAFIADHSNELNALLEEFDRLQNLYFADNLKVDTLNKTITFTASKELELNPDEFRQLKQLIVEIRELMIR
jgi:hypothetical protein